MTPVTPISLLTYSDTFIQAPAQYKIIQVFHYFHLCTGDSNSLNVNGTDYGSAVYSYIICVYEVNFLHYII